ncbi:MAG: type I DNA topoisomerase [Lentisphaerae bacterium]|nr:type I DNA topoisomerase [Lentisphaerota bacterium]
MANLLIVESPTKARTIGRMLGKDYDIIASMGHVRDLPEHDFGIDIANNFTPQYVDTPRSRPVIKSLKEAAKKADSVYLATDPDREGEAIAWHLKNLLAPVNKKAPFHRVTFHEITRQAIENAISARGDININLVDAQQARRVLDRIVGYQVSPLLWRKLGKGSSAGRVQSAALRLIVEREREILAFVPQEYWNFAASFLSAGNDIIKSKLFKINQKDFQINSADEAEKTEYAVRNGSVPQVSQVSTQERKRNPYPPFTTSTLQQAANQLLHYSATSTMRYAQQLYEGVDLGNGNSAGLITYMRTDSVTIAKEAQIAAAEFIRNNYGEEYLPPKFNYYKNKAAAQEAHEAIRPTDVRRTPESLSGLLDGPQLKLYTLIWKRFVASQMAQAKQELVTADVVITGSDRSQYQFRTTATLTIFPGFLTLSGEGQHAEKDDCRPALLRSLHQGDTLTMTEFTKEQKFTEPPPRFTEATLIKLLEENGIGRPSTYATIIRTIQDRSYVSKEQNKLLPTELGFTVNDFLVEKLPELFDIGFTAQMEQKLDDVETGSVGWVGMMREFYDRFAPWMTAAKNSGAPESDKAAALLNTFDGVTYAEKQKIGKRTFDDANFVNSVKEKFAATGQISEKQYQALLTMAAKYAEQTAGKIAGLAPELQDDYQEAFSRFQERIEAESQRPPVPENGGYAPVFDAFKNVIFPEAKSGRFAFDEGKFFKSLKRQALSGKALSEKQLSALKKMVVKYRDQLTDFNTVSEILQISAADIPEESAGDTDKIQMLIQKLSEVKEWAKPPQKGRFAFDEKKFYQSIARQVSDGRKLSAKQISALEKLAAKYLTGNQ